MSKRKGISREMKKEVIARYGSKCINCGSDTDIEWHHVVPIMVGGYDIPSNIVPLCHACHKSVTHCMMMVISHSLEHHKAGGRPRKWPRNYKDVIEDFVRCRISKSECTFRLNRNPSSYTYKDEFKDCLKELGIASYRNNIDTTLSHKDAIRPGDVVGRVTYLDGTVEEMIWGKETPLSGASSVPTSDHPKHVEVRKVSDYVNPFI